MPNKVEILLDKAAGNLSIIAIDDVDGCSVETTLSVEEAWALVADLNQAIRKITKLPEPRVVHNTYPKKNKSVVNAVSNTIISPSTPRVREAVLNSIGADNIRPRYSRPGAPSLEPRKGLRKLYEEPVTQ